MWEFRPLIQILIMTRTPREGRPPEPPVIGFEAGSRLVRKIRFVGRDMKIILRFYTKTKCFYLWQCFLFFMKCPYCGSFETKVVDKRETENEDVTRRRRECLECEKRFTTYERVESAPIYVIKKDGRRELFDKTKFVKGIIKACEKRPVSPEAIKEVANDIEQQLRAKEGTEISSSMIGKLVMTRLKKIDKVAYIRFASVYKDFKDPEEFQEELKKLKR